jgi:hypothetical protein
MTQYRVKEVGPNISDTIIPRRKKEAEGYN